MSELIAWALCDQNFASYSAVYFVAFLDNSSLVYAYKHINSVSKLMEYVLELNNSRSHAHNIAMISKRNKYLHVCQLKSATK